MMDAMATLAGGRLPPASWKLWDLPLIYPESDGSVVRSGDCVVPGVLDPLPGLNEPEHTLF